MNRKTLLTVAALVLLAGLYYLSESRPNPGQDLSWSVPPLKDVIDKAQIVRGGETMTLEKRDGRWWISSPRQLKASQSSVDGLLGLFERKVGVDLRIPVSEDELGRYELDPEHAIALTLWAGGEQKTSFLVGKAAGNRTFVKPEGETAVYRARAMLRSKLDKELNDWRENKLFELKRDDVVELTLHLSDEEGGAVRLLRAKQPAQAGGGEAGYGDAWTVASSIGNVEEPADKSTVSALLGAVSNLRAAHFADGLSAAETGFGPDSYRVTLTLRAGKGDPQTLVFGGDVGEERFEGKYKEDRFAMREGGETVYVVRGYSAKSTRKTLAELRNKVVFEGLKRNEITGLRLETNGNIVVLAKEGEIWKAAEPAELAGKLDMSPLNSLLSSLANLRAARVLQGVDDSAGGFTPELRKARLTISSKEGPTRVLLVGSMADQNKKEWYAREEGSPAPVWVLRDYVVRQLAKGPDGFKKKDAA